MRLLFRKFSVFVACAALIPAAITPLWADEPLHVQIDNLLDAATVGPAAELCSDAEFLRRASVHLVGMVPSIIEIKAFLADDDPAKRQKTVDRLLADPRFARHTAQRISVMLMERRADKHVKADEWEKYLLDSFQANKPLDQLVREILSSDGADPKLRPAAKFFLDREVEPHQLTRDFGRVFLGRDLQCAQCHNHPLIDGYLQSDYYGIFAFVNRAYLFASKKDKKSYLADKPTGDVRYKSVFTGIEGFSGARLPGGIHVTDPHVPTDKQYKVAPAKDVRPVPTYSRRAQLAPSLITATNEAFNRNMANRLWSFMFGRGIVHPLDLHHSANPPSHPALLKLLTSSLPAMKYDTRKFLRELALSKAYQRSFDMPDSLDEFAVETQSADFAALQKNHDTLAKSLSSAEEKLIATTEAVAKQRAALAPHHDERTKLTGALGAAVKVTAKASAAVAATQKTLTPKKLLQKTFTDAFAAIEAVQKMIPEDKEINDTAALFKKRLAAINAQVVAVEKKLTAQTAALQAAQKKQTDAQNSVTQKTKSFEELVAAVRVEDKKLEALRTQFNDQSYEVAVSESKLETMRELVAYADRTAEVRSAIVAMEQTREQLTVAQRRSSGLAAEFKTARTRQDEAAAQLTSRTTELQKAVTMAASKAEINKNLSESIAKLDAALAQLQDDAGLAAIAAQLKSRHKEIIATQATQQTQVAQIQMMHDQAAATKKTADAKVSADQDALLTVALEIGTLQGQHDRLVADRSRAEEAAAENYGNLNQRWVQKFAVRALEPLTPEEMTWSVLEATGMLDQYRIAAKAEVEKKAAAAKETLDASALAVRIEQAVYDKLKANQTIFIKLFGGGAGQPQDTFFATADQALFFGNGGTVWNWSVGGRLARSAVALDDPTAIAEEVYAGVLSRRPTQDEISAVRDYLTARTDAKASSVHEIVWGLVTSTEFRFNH